MSKYNPPPPGPTMDESKKYNNLKLEIIKGGVPSFPYLNGLPVQYITISKEINNSIITPIIINFQETPFTYLNFTNVEGSNSPEFTVILQNFPIGGSFIVNTPNSWESNSGKIELDDNTLPNYSITIGAKDQNDQKTRDTQANVIIYRNDSGLVGSYLDTGIFYS